MTDQAFDVVVVGAGTAGSAAAAFLAASGTKVALVEKRDFDRAGAQWTTDIPPWMFDEAGLKRPDKPEKHLDHVPIAVEGPKGLGRFELPARPMWAIHTPRLIARLHSMAHQHDVAMFDRVVIEDMTTRQDRLVQLTVAAGRNGDKRRTRLKLRGDLFVDASGMAGVLRSAIPTVHARCPHPHGAEVCAAAQQVCTVRDKAEAKRFLDDHGIEVGTILARTGEHGAYSTEMVRVSEDLERVEILAGTMNDGRHATGPEVIRAFKESHPWVGKRTSGGVGLIPIRKPYERFVFEGLALIGDAACQVFPAHGSGVGSGLVAARLLSQAVVAGGDPGSLRTLWAYQHDFSKARGHVHVVFDAMRAATAKLTAEDVNTLFSCGMVDSSISRHVFDQRLPGPPVQAVFRSLAMALNHPGTAWRLFSPLPGMIGQYVLCLATPRNVDSPLIPLWDRVARLSASRAA